MHFLGVVIVVGLHRKPSMLTLCLIMLVWTCSTKYAPLVIVCM